MGAEGLATTSKRRGRPKGQKGLPRGHNTRAGESGEPSKKKVRAGTPTSSDEETDASPHYIVAGVTLNKDEVDRITGEGTTSPYTVTVMSRLLKAKCGQVSGLLDCEDVLHPDFDGLVKTQKCIQVHFNDVNHFFTSTWNPD